MLQMMKPKCKEVISACGVSATLIPIPRVKTQRLTGGHVLLALGKEWKGSSWLDQEHVATAVQGGTFVQGTPFWALAGLPDLNHTTAVQRAALES